MFLGKRIKELRDEKGLLQRQLAAELEIDSPMYSKIERGERRAKREQVIKLAKLLQADENELLTLWLAGQIYEIVKDEKVAKAAMNIVETQIR
jgi:transcriptional regulator with XRE-family HTH domain